MVKHKIEIEIDVEDDGSFSGKIVNSDHPRFEYEDKIALAFSFLHLTHEMITAANEIETGLNLTLIDNIMEAMEVAIHSYLNGDGVVQCDHVEDDQANTEYESFFKYKYTAGLTKADLN